MTRITNEWTTSSGASNNVVGNGRITYERCKTMTPEMRHNWFSSGKVISATLLSMLEHVGKADLTKPASCYLPQLK
jgi:hypothetical protein